MLAGQLSLGSAVDRSPLDLLVIADDLDLDRVLQRVLATARSAVHARRFTARDQRRVETLAAYAGVAIANARLYRQAQELATVEERARVARELHDSVSQRLFSMVYQARAAALRTSEPAARDALSGL